MIVIEGNDGVGKTTLVEKLRALGFLVMDRWWMSDATVGKSVDHAARRKDRTILLDCSPVTSLKRLQAAGKDMAEHWHQPQTLGFYREKFLQLADVFGVPVVSTENNDPDETLRAVLEIIDGTRLLRIGIPTGRLRSNVLGLMAAVGLSVDGVRSPQILSAKFLHTRPSTIAKMIDHGLLDAGFCGIDSIREHKADIYGSPLGVNKVRIVAASDEPFHKLRERFDERLVPLRVVSEYPRLASEFCGQRSLPAMVLQSSGGSEAWVPDFADMVIDVVETGATLKAHGLQELETLFESETVFAYDDHRMLDSHPLRHTLFAPFFKRTT